LIIAEGSSCQAKQWRNRGIEWDEEFLDKLRNTHRTTETIEEFRKMSKAEQLKVKDVGGFVFGKLKNGIRKKGCVEARYAVTYDSDDATPNLMGDAEALGFTGCVYSTHQHTPEKPRLRIIIPTSRAMSEEEYEPIARKIAQDLGIEQFDRISFRPTQMMFYPSTSIDAEYIFEEWSGKPLNPDNVLARYEEWRDVSQWPTAANEIELVQHDIKKQADPLEKKDLIGAFCRAYSIEDAIETFLVGVYEPCSMEGRYSYVGGSTFGGVVTYKDKFSYSHHASDPASGRLCNAYDLVRLHKFGELDTEVEEGKPMGKLPSFVAMLEFATKDPAVKRQLAEERLHQSQMEFVDADWQEHLDINKKGVVLNTLKNLTIILENDPNLKSIVFNQLSDGMEIKGDVPWKHPNKWWRDADDAQLISYVDKNYAGFSQRSFNIAVTKVTDDRSYHPIREYLMALPDWDGMKRLDTLFIEYLGAKDNEYVRAVTRKVLTAAVARVFEPGIKFDWMLVLNGPGGIGKSTLINMLGGQWFSDSLQLSDTHNKTAAEKLQGYWIMEIGELSGMKRTEQDALKQFISSQNDIYRASFGRRATPHLRQCIFIGTTNSERGYLRDTTGNRRFWPVQVSTSNKKPWNLTDEEITQIWAEAKVRYHSGETLQLSEELERYAEQMQNEAMEVDDREGIIEAYLNKLLPDDWESKDIYERRNYLIEYHNKGSIIPKGNNPRTTVSALEIWCEAFGKNQGEIKRTDSLEICAMLRRIEGWESKGKLQTSTLYGRQKVFEKVNCERTEPIYI